MLPSDLLEKYCVEGGMYKLEYDLAILNEIHDQVNTAQGNTKDGNAMEARRKQRNAARKDLDDGDAMKLLKDGGFL